MHYLTKNSSSLSFPALVKFKQKRENLDSELRYDVWSMSCSNAWKIIDFPKPVGKINENVCNCQFLMRSRLQKLRSAKDTVIWSNKRSKVIGPSSYVQRRLAPPGLEIISQLVLVKLFIQTYFCSDATRFWAYKYL